MTKNDGVEKVARYQAALNQLTERITADRYVLAVVLVGSLSEETIWRRDTLGLWIIEADGVSRRLPSDGNDERVVRILVENGINIHAEVIPRSRFKKMVEGASRTAFSCNFFARRQVVYSKDPSIDAWFKQADSIATKDQERELLTFSTWTIHAHRHARNAWTSKATSSWRRRKSWGPPTAWGPAPGPASRRYSRERPGPREPRPPANRASARRPRSRGSGGLCGPGARRRSRHRPARSQLGVPPWIAA